MEKMTTTANRQELKLWRQVGSQNIDVRLSKSLAAERGKLP